MGTPACLQDKDGRKQMYTPIGPTAVWNTEKPNSLVECHLTATDCASRMAPGRPQRQRSVEASHAFGILRI
jgi:hypothetical protein